MSLNQINLLFQHLPVDLSYVDEKELVAFYSDTKHRVFPRSKGVIGRDVKNCHPKNSVATVESIIEKFRNNEEDKVEFWINKPDMMVIDVLNQYPGLKEYMVKKSDKFKMLNSPMFKMMKKIATVKILSERTGIELDVLQKEFTKYIEEIK